MSAASAPGTFENTPWYRQLNGYQWFVLSVATMGWMFDTMAQQLFNLARNPAIRDLLGPGASAGEIAEQAGFSTSIFMIGWATGGVLFGVLGDRIGRANIPRRLTRDRDP